MTGLSILLKNIDPGHIKDATPATPVSPVQAPLIRADPEATPHPANPADDIPHQKNLLKLSLQDPPIKDETLLTTGSIQDKKSDTNIASKKNLVMVPSEEYLKGNTNVKLMRSR